uniref:adenosylcobinamide-phosphate synthase CbiB n=1 Tax=Nocardioides sp. SYSU DS0663 TaxID=3416445 RepID=UPI003F4B2992
AWALGAVAAATAGVGLSRAARRLPGPLGSVVVGASLWPLLSARLLLEEVAAVEAALGSGRPSALVDGRRALARIVSRDTSDLTTEEVRAAALESLAENLSDSVVAPLWWFAVAGLPGAALYRYANTADAMWGYRTERWEHAGKAAARADDALNLVPARLTALLLAGPRPSVLRRLRREARRTASPNAGWPMAALALRSDVALAKPGAYTLHPAGAQPRPEDVTRALALARRAAVTAGLLTAAATLRPPARHHHLYHRPPRTQESPR